MSQQAIKSAQRALGEIRTTVAAIACIAMTMLGCAQSDDAGGAADTSSAGPEGTIASALAAPVVAGLLAAGNAHSCAVVGGGLQCWGSNSAGQLGDGSTVPQNFNRVQVAGLASNKLVLTAGGSNTCAIVGGAAKCWGENGLGQLGNAPAGNDVDARPNSNIPVNVTGLSSGVQAISTGNAHSCAVVNGAARCWGDNAFGQVGNGGPPSPPSRSPAPVSGLASGVQAVAGGGSHSCAIVSGGARCWGFNGNGQLGNATAGNPQPGDSIVPVQVTGLTSGVQAIAAGSLHTCAVVNGGVQCWGDNSAGQLGIGVVNPNPVRAPVIVPTLTTGVLTIAAGNSHTCALLTGGAVKCWGDNTSGQLGTGGGSSSIPVSVGGLPAGILALVAGSQHTCAATHDQAWCWGTNASGQLAFDPDVGGQSDLPHLIAGLILGACGDGSDEQVFDNGMSGCAGAVAFANRGSLCAPGYQPATALQWVSNRGAGVSLHNYWTNDPLMFSGAGPSACTVSLSIGFDCGPATPMRVCTSAGTDAEGNACNWQHCGLYANTPDNMFGGCAGNGTAGTLCIPTGSPANACTSVRSCAKWENGIVRIPASGTTLEPTTTFGTGVRHVQQTCHFFSCDPATITGSISPALTTTCQTATDARSNQLKAAVANSVAVEGNFDSVFALNQRSAEAQATVGATRAGQTIQQFNQQSIPLGPPGVVLNNWDERWMCQNNVVNAAPATAPNDACGCNN